MEIELSIYAESHSCIHIPRYNLNFPDAACFWMQRCAVYFHGIELDVCLAWTKKCIHTYFYIECQNMHGKKYINSLKILVKH